MARTQQERMIEALEKQGHRRVESRSTKYVVMTRTHCGYYFLGKAGSLRYGRNYTESYPQDNLKARLLKEVPQ